MNEEMTGPLDPLVKRDILLGVVSVLRRRSLGVHDVNERAAEDAAG